MENKVLVAYASRYGSTAEIAEKIGEELRQAGLQVDVLRVKGVNEVRGYKAIIVGSAIYMGRWRKEAVKFLKNNEKLLTEQPVWLFSSGPTAKGDPIELNKGQKFPGRLTSVIERIKPRDVTIFHGVTDAKKLDFFTKFIITKIVRSSIGDFRDWNTISAWAKTIAKELNNKKND